MGEYSWGKGSLILSLSLIICFVIQVIVGLLAGTWVSENALYNIFFIIITVIAMLHNILGAIFGFVGIFNDKDKKIAFRGVFFNILSLLIICIGNMFYYLLVLGTLDMINRIVK